MKKKHIPSLFALILAVMLITACGNGDVGTTGGTVITSESTTAVTTIQTTATTTQTVQSTTQTIVQSTTNQPTVDTTAHTTTAQTTTAQTTTAQTTIAQTTVAPHVHVFGEWETVKSATCTETGTQSRKCSCGATETKTIGALGHTIVVDKGTAATCATVGLTDGKHCGVCNKVLIAQQVLNTSSHTFKVTYEIPTWFEEGLIHKICTTCQYQDSDITITPYYKTLYGYNSFADYANAASMQKMYYDLYMLLEKLHFSKKDFSLNNIIEFPLDSYSLPLDEAVAVWITFYKENPQFYWIDNTITINNFVLNINVNKAYYKYEDREIYNRDITLMIEECGALLSSARTTLEKVKIIHDFITQKIEYAYISGTNIPETALWAHNIIGTASKGAGVCESYAKTFLLLCELNNIDCVLVTGTAGNEYHAWNMVYIDNEWYNIDATWNDTNQNYAYFGKTQELWEKDHTADANILGVNYQYDLPAACDDEIQMVSLYEENEYMGLYTSIDSAFRVMDDNSKEYFVEFIDDIDCEYKIESTVTPTVKKITLNGKIKRLGEFFDVSAVRIPEYLSISGDFTIENLELFIKGTGILNIQNSTFETKGYYCALGTQWEGFEVNGIKIQMRICDSNSNAPSSKILVNTEYLTEFYCIVDVFSVEEGILSQAKNLSDIDGIMFREDTSLQFLDAKNVQFVEVHRNRPTVIIDNIIIRENDIYRNGMEIDNVDITIGNITFLHESSLWFSFDSIEDVPDLIFAEKIDGKIHIYFYSDGNNCFLIDGTLFTIKQKEHFSLFTIYLSSKSPDDDSNYLIESTDMLKCNDNGNVVFRNSVN